MSDSTVIGELAELRWRGLRAPCESAPFKFSHSQAERRYPYIDGAGHDWTGMDPIPMTARLYFVNTIEPNSFPDNWNKWQTALFDGSPDELVHPVLGRVFARVLDGSVEVVAHNRGGIVVEVSWTSTREDLDSGLVFETINVDAEATAAAVDASLADIGVSLPVTIPPTTSILEAYKKVKGELFSASLSLTGPVNQLLGITAQLIDDVIALNDVKAWPAIANLTAMFNALQQTIAKLASSAARQTSTIKTQNDTTLDALADLVGNSFTDLLSLNLSLVDSPVVPRGSIVRFYVS